MSSLFLCLPLSLALLISIGCHPSAERGPRYLLDGSFILPPETSDTESCAQAAQRILDSKLPIDDKGPKKVVELGLWKSSPGVHPGLPFSVSSLPSSALAGVDKPHVGQESIPMAWQALCSPSPIHFLRRGSGRHGATIPEMIGQPVPYGTWEEQEMISRRSQKEIDQLGRELHEV